MRTNLGLVMLLAVATSSCSVADGSEESESALETAEPRSLSMSILGSDPTPAGATTYFTVTTTSFGGGPSETVNLSLGGLPAGVRGELSPSFLFAGQRARLALRIGPDVPASRFSFTVFANGSAGFASASAVADVIRIDGDPGVDRPLTLGASAAGLSNERSTATYYRFEVPEGTTRVEVTLAGGEGDADLYVRRGERPSLVAWGCRSIREGSSERCKLSAPPPGTYFALVHGYTAYAGVTLSAAAE